MRKLPPKKRQKKTRLISASWDKIYQRWLLGCIVFLVVAVGVTYINVSRASTPALSLCGNPGPAPVAIKHVIVVMIENLSYSQVVGSTKAPFQTSLASKCGVATAMFGATHTSAVNYLALSAAEYPPQSPPGCGQVSKCADGSDNLYNQLTQKGLSWKGYIQQMPSPCDKTNIFGEYQIGHNPIIFYSDIPGATCQANDLGVTDLTAQSGAFWTDLQNQTLPSFSWITPHDCDGCGYNETINDTWLKNFIGTVEQSNSYQSGDTAILVTYDEGGRFADKVTGEDCTNMSLDLPITNGVSAHQESCHIPFFVVYPYTPAGTQDSTFFDHYSVTKTVEDIFGLPYLAHAADAQTTSLIGHFGLSLATPAPACQSTSTSICLGTSSDTYVSYASPDSNFGNTTPLWATANEYRSFLRFSTNAAIPAGKTVLGAKLKLYVTNNATSSGALEVHPEANTWVGKSVTWHTQPTWDPTVLATSSLPSAGSWITINLPPSAVATTSPTSLGLRYTVAGSATQFASREDPAHAPQLVVQLSP